MASEAITTRDWQQVSEQLKSNGFTPLALVESNGQCVLDLSAWVDITCQGCIACLFVFVLRGKVCPYITFHGSKGRLGAHLALCGVKPRLSLLIARGCAAAVLPPPPLCTRAFPKL
jgi:hypothetical protein